MHACHQGIPYHGKRRVAESGRQRENVEEHDCAGCRKDEPHCGEKRPECVQMPQMQQNVSVNAKKDQGSQKDEPDFRRLPEVLPEGCKEGGDDAALFVANEFLHNSVESRRGSTDRKDRKTA